jgi:hypothetical protein
LRSLATAEDIAVNGLVELPLPQQNPQIEMQFETSAEDLTDASPPDEPEAKAEIGTPE